MAFNQFKTLEEKIQYVWENHDRLEQERHQKADKKIEEYKICEKLQLIFCSISVSRNTFY